MIQALQQPTTFDEFIEWLPETSECRYELHRGAIVEMPKPKGKHSDVAGFLTIEAGIAIRAAKLPYFIPKECIVRTVDGASGYEPDAIAQALSYMMATPHPQQPAYGLATNRSEFRFIKTAQQPPQYGLSDLLTLQRRENDLYGVLRTLRRVGILVQA